MKDARDQVATCPTWTVPEDDGTKLTFRVTQLSTPKVADETMGFGIHMDITAPDGRTAQAKGFALGARIGQNLVGHVHMAVGFNGTPSIDPAESEAILRKAVQKFKRVTATSA
jgi:hypothetical protein